MVTRVGYHFRVCVILIYKKLIRLKPSDSWFYMLQNLTGFVGIISYDCAWRKNVNYLTGSLFLNDLFLSSEICKYERNCILVEGIWFLLLNFWFCDGYFFSLTEIIIFLWKLISFGTIVFLWLGTSYYDRNVHHVPQVQYPQCGVWSDQTSQVILKSSELEEEWDMEP